MTDPGFKYADEKDLDFIQVKTTKLNKKVYKDWCKKNNTSMSRHIRFLVKQSTDIDLNWS